MANVPETFLPLSARRATPPLYGQENLPEKTAYFVHWLPGTNWRWISLELDQTTGLAFGIVIGQETEYGYYQLHDLLSIRGPFGNPVEFDYRFKPTPLSNLRL